MSKYLLQNFVKNIGYSILLSMCFTQFVSANILVSDFSDDVVYEFDDAGNLLGIFGDASPQDSELEGFTQNILLNSSNELLVSSANSTFSGVLKFDASGSYIGKFASAGSSAQEGLELDSQGNLYLTTGSTLVSGNLWKFDIDGNGGVIATLSKGRGDIGIDSSDNIYVLTGGPDSSSSGSSTFNKNDEVHKFSSDGTFIEIFISGLTDGSSLEFNAQGDLFLIDNGVLLKFDSQGALLQTLPAPPTGDGTPARNLTMDPAGNIYATDGSEDKVFKYDSNGIFIQTIIEAGVGGVPANFRPEGIVFIDSHTFQLARNTWQLISLPAVPPANANTVQDIFADDITGSYATEWQLFAFDTANNAYDALELTDTLAPGAGYWIIQISMPSASLDMPADSTSTPPTAMPACATTACLSIALTSTAIQQHNLVGNPFYSTPAVDDFRVTTSSGVCSDADGCSMAESQAANIVYSSFAWYDGSNYQSLISGDSFEIWRGYWSKVFEQATELNPVLRIPAITSMASMADKGTQR